MEATIWTPQLIIFLAILAIFFLLTLAALLKGGPKEAIPFMKTLLTINSAVLGAGITYFFTRSTVDEAVASRAALSAEVRQSKAEVGRLDGALKTQAQQAAALHQETLALQNALTKSLEYVPVAQKRVLMQQVKPLLEKSGDAQPPEAPRPEAPR